MLFSLKIEALAMSKGLTFRFIIHYLLKATECQFFSRLYKIDIDHQCDKKSD